MYDRCIIKAMIDAATIVTATLPTVAVLFGILINRSDATRLDARISGLETSLRGAISGLEKSLRGEISGLENSLRGEISGIRGELASIRTQFHNDVLMLVGRDQEQDKRITQLEGRT